MPTTVVSPGCLLLLHRRRRLILVRLHPEVLERVVQLLGLLQGHRLGCGGGGTNAVPAATRESAGAGEDDA